MPQGQIALGLECPIFGNLAGMGKKPDAVTADPAASEMQRQTGLRIRAIRKLSGLKQTQISDALGVDQSTWSKWERGEREPDIHIMSRFAARARASLDLIYRGVADGAHPALAELMRLSVPDLLVESPMNKDRDKDMALASYRSAIHQVDGQ